MSATSVSLVLHAQDGHAVRIIDGYDGPIALVNVSTWTTLQSCSVEALLNLADACQDAARQLRLRELALMAAAPDPTAVSA